MGTKRPCEPNRMIHQRRMVMTRQKLLRHNRVAALVSQLHLGGEVLAWPSLRLPVRDAASYSRSWRLKAMTAKFDDEWPVGYDGYTADRHLLLALARETSQIAPLAQLDRASGYEPEGREFESLRARHFQPMFTR